MILVSPAEPEALRMIGTTSSIPERYGADFYFAIGEGDETKAVGIQRKEVKDLVNSLRDGRLAKELGQMRQLDVGIILVEGDWRWTTGGASLRVNGFTKGQWRGLTYSIQSQGFWLTSSESLVETIECVSSLRKWLTKERHSLVQNRPKASSSWGKATNRDWGVHLLQSFEGIGAGVAGDIYDHFGGVPLIWTVGTKDLMTVKGVGKKRAEGMLSSLPLSPATLMPTETPTADDTFVDLSATS